MTLIPDFAMAIVAMCAPYEGTRYYDACMKAADAGTRQVGIRQSVDQAQSKINSIVSDKVEKTVGRKVVTMVATGGFLLRTFNTKTISFRLPTLGLANSVENEVSPTTYKLVMKWNW